MTAPVGGGASNRRALLFLAGGGGLLLLLFLVTRVLGGGGGGEDLSAPITAPNRPGGTPSVTPDTTIVPGAPPEETFEVFSTKNPFTPLAPTGGGTTTGTQPPTTGGGGTTTGTQPPITGGGGTTATTQPPTTGGGGTTTGTQPPITGGGTTAGTAPATEPRASQRVALLDIYEEDGRRVANVRVNDTVYEGVGPGDEFAGSFRVVSLDDRCGTFLYGDDRFRVCQGEEVLK